MHLWILWLICRALLSCTFVLPPPLVLCLQISCLALLSCTLVLHSWLALLACTLGLHSWLALLACTADADLTLMPCLQWCMSLLLITLPSLPPLLTLALLVFLSLVLFYATTLNFEKKMIHLVQSPATNVLTYSPISFTQECWQECWHRHWPYPRH